MTGSQIYRAVTHNMYAIVHHGYYDRGSFTNRDAGSISARC